MKTIKIKVQYFAALREQRGARQEEVETSAKNARDLYEELSARHGFALPASLVKVSINLELKSLDAAISDGDEIVFIPPVAGG